MRLFNYTMIIVGLMILFYLAGINTTIGFTLNTLNIVDNPAGLATNSGADDVNTAGDLYTKILLILTAVAVGGVVIGFFTKTSPENYLIAPLAILLLGFVGDIVFIITHMRGVCPVGSSCAWASWVTLLIMGTMAVGYLITVIDWWRGRD